MWDDWQCLWYFAVVEEMDREECWEIYWYAWIAADIH